MTRRASVHAKTEDESPGGSKPKPESTSRATRRANAVPKPIKAAPGGSMHIPQPDDRATRPGVSSLQKLIREADTDHSVEEVELARVVLDALLRSGQLDLLLPILADEIRRIRRAQVRRIERRVGESPSAQGGWLQLLPEGFATVDGRFVTWGEATVEDHEGRIEWLQGQIEALGQDVERHQQAIKLIREHGVTCLAEVEAAA